MQIGVLHALPVANLQGHEPELQRSKERLGRERFSESDQKLIPDFLEHSQAQGVSAGRFYKLAWSSLGIRRMIGCDFDLAADTELAGRYKTYNRPTEH
jgi:hypothetical protein